MAENTGLTHDSFLGGRVYVWQTSDGFRAGIDAVLLAAGVAANAGESVLELGCGVGTASLCLAERVPGVQLVGVELQPEYAALARRNAAEATANFEVFTADLRALPVEVRGRSFDHVIANPPYFLPKDGTAAANPGRDTALRGETDLSVWVDSAIRRTRPGGYIVFIQRADRLADLLCAMDKRVGAVELLPLLPRAGKSARLVIVRARTGRRTPLRLLAPRVLHAGTTHAGDSDDYTPEISGVLRDAMPLAFEDL